MPNARFAILPLLLFLTTSFAVSAASIRGGLPVCFSEEALDEFITAASNKDKRQMMALLDGQCVIAKAGLEVSVISSGFSVYKVRIYAPSGKSMVMYTVSENVQR